MTALDHTTMPASAASARAIALVTRVAAVIKQFWRTRTNRRQASGLRDLSDHQLADIGLTRADVEIALHAPLNTDPTTRLSAMARERYWTEFGARRVC